MRKLALFSLVSFSAIAGRVIELDSLSDNRTKATLATATELAYLSGATASVQSQLNTLRGDTAGLVAKTGDSMSGPLNIGTNSSGVFNGLSLTNNATTGSITNAQALFNVYDGSSVSLIGAVGVSGNNFSFQDYLPNQIYLEGLGTGGVTINSQNATGEIRFYTGGGSAGNKRAFFDTSGNFTLVGGTFTANGNIAGTASLTGVTSLTVGAGLTSLGGNLNVSGSASLLGTTVSNLQTTGNILMAGNMAIGGSASSAVGLWLKSTKTLSGASEFGFSAGPTFSGTTAGYSFESFPNLQAGVTTAVIDHYLADGLGKGASAIATNNGVFVAIGGALTGGANNAVLSDNNSWTGNYFINQSGTTPTLLGGTVAVNSLTASSLVATDGSKNLVSKGLPSSFMQFNSGALTSVVANQIISFGLVPRAVTIENVTAIAASFTCAITNPVLTLYDCGSSPTDCTSGRTALASVTLTAATTKTDGTVTTPGMVAGHYWAWETTAGSCTALNAIGSAEFVTQ